MPACCPRRGDNQRYAVAQSHCSAPGVVLLLSLGQLLFQGGVFDTWIDALGTFARFFFIRVRRYERRDVVKIAVVLIIGHDEEGLLPHLGVLGVRVYGFRYVPRAVPGRCGVVRVSFGWYHPGDRG